MKVYRFRLDQPPITPAELKELRRFTTVSIILVALVAISVFVIGSGIGSLLLLPLGVTLLFLLHSADALRSAETFQEDKLASMKDMELLDDTHLAFIRQVAQLNRRLIHGEAKGLIVSARAAEMKRRRESLYQSPRAER